MSDSNNNLGELIESTRQDAQAQQAEADAKLNSVASQPRGKQMLTAVLMVVFAVVLFYQYPRFAEPYTWPDPATNSGAAEGVLIEVVGLVESYRISQGRYPDTLSQIAIPAGLSALITDSVLLYKPGEQSYKLDWTLAHWHASYDSQTEKVSVTPSGKQ
jgi:hypothetical protein